MEAIDILKAAKGKLAAPEDWGKGRRGINRPHATCCAAEAIEESSDFRGDTRMRALKALYNAAGIDWGRDSITVWNDDPERTHDEVLAAFSLAIATLRL